MQLLVDWLQYNQGFIRKYKCIAIKCNTKSNPSIHELGAIYFHNLRILNKEKRCPRCQSGNGHHLFYDRDIRFICTLCENWIKYLLLTTVIKKYKWVLIANLSVAVLNRWWWSTLGNTVVGLTLQPRSHLSLIEMWENRKQHWSMLSRVLAAYQVPQIKCTWVSFVKWKWGQNHVFLAKQCHGNWRFSASITALFPASFVSIEVASEAAASQPHGMTSLVPAPRPASHPVFVPVVPRDLPSIVEVFGASIRICPSSFP